MRVDVRLSVVTSTSNFVAFSLVRTLSSPHSCLHGQPQATLLANLIRVSPKRVANPYQGGKKMLQWNFQRRRRTVLSAAVRKTYCNIFYFLNIAAVIVDRLVCVQGRICILLR
ncbi:hypothetical protein K443DRAFT_618136 [Laccaria amethystina LaAM-08-1]|uniref:Uncharacterized protein n=1 Tax=Laccaria amethystina LaAM-08-1 TaxID=1095629 RepID=A0A0C9XVU8_9AGAR|nr:hypothetical protein K443DRAFT_618136 [Laccaria amethystina LaAM-08-1]